MKEFFEELFEYNNHFNQELAKSIIDSQGLLPEKLTRLFCHILNAHEIWNSRIQGKANVYGVWDIHHPRNYNEILHLNYETSKAIIEKLTLEQTIKYSNGKRQRKVSDVLFHIINHSTYHRGQIATLFRENEIEPVTTDYIHYVKKD